MELQATPAFLKFAEAAARECTSTRGTILFLNYVRVRTRTKDGKKWVLDLVKRADFSGASVMTVNGWEMLYQPAMKQELSDSILDFQGNQIIVRPFATPRK